MAHDARAVANYFIKKAKEDTRVITAMQLQKLVYFAHGWNLAIFAKPLIGEPVEAWRFGPVIRSLYDEFKKYGGDPIRTVVPGFSPNFLSEEQEVIDRVWEVYGHLHAFQLSELTHKGGTPWDKVWNLGGGCFGRSTEIPDGLIKEYFMEVGSGRTRQ